MLKWPVAALLNRLGLRLGARATAALEFALLAPILILLLFAVYDTSEAFIVYEEVFTAAHQIPASVSSLAIQSDATTKLTYAQIQSQASAIWAEIPNLRNGRLQNPNNTVGSVTISSINFEKHLTACVPAAANGNNPAVQCNYDAYVVWSVSYTGPTGAGAPANPVFNDVLRGPTANPCGTTTNTTSPSGALNQVPPNQGASSDLTTVRTKNITTPDPVVAPPDPIIVVDVHLQYTPVFNFFIKAPIDFWANGYWPVRSVAAKHLVNGAPVALAPDQQYTSIVATPTGSSPAYTIPGATAGAYCISSYYPEPSS